MKPSGATDFAAARSNAPAGDNKVKRTYRWHIFLWFLLIIALLSAVCGFIYHSINNFESELTWVEHTHQVREEAFETFSALKDAESSVRLYVVTAQPEPLEESDKNRQEAEAHLNRLQELTADNQNQQQRVSRLTEAIRRKLAFGDALADARRQQGFEAAQQLALTGRGRQEMETIRELVKDILDEEARLLIERNAKAQSSTREVANLAYLGVALSLVALLVMCLMIRREGIRRLTVEEGLEQTNARLEQGLHKMKQLTDEMNLLNLTGELLQSCLTVKEAGKVVSKTASELLPDTSGALCIINPSKNHVESVETWGANAPSGVVFAPEECWVLRRGRMHAVQGDAPHPVCEHVGDADAQDCMCVPLAAHGETLGVLHLRAQRRGALADIRQQVISSLAEQFSLALANLRLQQTLRSQSIRDPLTGLFNRRYMEASLEREMLRAKRNGAPMSVIMLDVDHFKRFNDTFGHSAGDAVIQEVGQLLKSNARGEDIACRYGGEEFMLILTGAPLAVARERAAQIGEAIRRLQVRRHGQPLAAVTVSLGVATYPEHCAEAKELVRIADDALYRAKRAGRDRVVVAEREDAARFEVGEQFHADAPYVAHAAHLREEISF